MECAEFPQLVVRYVCVRRLLVLFNLAPQLLVGRVDGNKGPTSLCLRLSFLYSHFAIMLRWRYRRRNNGRFSGRFHSRMRYFQWINYCLRSPQSLVPLPLQRPYLCVSKYLVVMTIVNIILLFIIISAVLPVMVA